MRAQLSSGRRRSWNAVAAIGLSGIVAAALPLLAQVQTQEPEETYRAHRETMVREQIEQRGIKDKAVLAAIRKVPRHRFVPAALRHLAYTDGPLPIGEGQTISQPEIVAMMTELIKPDKKMRVLEIGTGSGYQAAVLAECVEQVDSIEVVEELGKSAETVLRELGYRKCEDTDWRRLRGLGRPSSLRRDHLDGRTAARNPATAAGATESRRKARRPRRPIRTAVGSNYQRRKPATTGR